MPKNAEPLLLFRLVFVEKDKSRSVSFFHTKKEALDYESESERSGKKVVSFARYKLEVNNYLLESEGE